MPEQSHPQPAGLAASPAGDELAVVRPERPTSSPPSLETYWASLPDDRRSDLRTVRQLLLRIWPELKEDMSLNMPTYHLNGAPFCALASQKHYMAIYILPYDLLDVFRLELLVYDRGRTCIRFKRLSPELVDLLDRMVKYIGTRFEESVHHGRQRNVHTYLRHGPPEVEQP